ncbi:MAG: succinylglutamate desuccinylase/aspartoacylase family protein [Planctomycetes bacterium]|nr:succinylglutamate desuccinylase/aspartoacylase family protein [Planctomycetota bacterium]
MLPLTLLNELPTGFLEISAADLWRIVPGPTLVHLPGRRPEPLFVSILLHGNEDVGLLAVQNLLKQLARRPLPRALSIFLGNIDAARAGVRRLPGQPDYNRVWPGSDDDGTSEHALMRAVTAEMQARRPFASVDLHNNTGRNPFYACVNRLDWPVLHLAALFSRTVVYFLRPHGVQSQAFGPWCPAVTCECGKVGDPAGVAHTTEFLDSCLHLAEIPSHPIAPGDIHVFHTVATVKIPPDVTFGFETSETDLTFSAGLEALNFQELPAGTRLAGRRPDSTARLDVRDETNQDVTAQFLEYAETEIRLRRGVMPSMLTCNEPVIRQDCLGYFMERFPLPAGLGASPASPE